MPFSHTKNLLKQCLHSRKKQTCAVLSLAFILISAVNLTSCSAQDLSLLENRFVDDTSAMKNPLFWDFTTTVNKKNGLFTLNSKAVMSQPINAMRQIGNNILFVEQYTEQPLGLKNSDKDSNPTEITNYKVYSPWTDSIIGSIRGKDMTTPIDQYCILPDNRLVVYGYGKSNFSLYDSNLELIGHYSIKKSGEILTNLAGISGSNQLFCSSADGKRFLQISFPEGSKKFSEKEKTYDATVTSIDCPLTSLSVTSAENGSGQILCSGIDTATFRQSVYSFNPTDDSAGTFNLLIDHTNYISGDFSEDAFIAQSSPAQSIWTYHSGDSLNQHFMDEDLTSVRLLHDGSFIAYRHLLNPQKQSETIQLIHYSDSGEILQSANYRIRSGTDKTQNYVSPNFAVFEKKGLVFMLIYNASSNPYLLVWNYTQDHSPDKNLDDLVLYEDIEDAKFDAVEQKSADDPDTYAPYSAISDIENYDWGNLENARSLADQIEADYHIKIYIGDQVPDSIDIYGVDTLRDPQLLENSLLTFENILASYPSGFFDQLVFGDCDALRFYFGGRLNGSGDNTIDEAAAYVTEQNNSNVMVLDATMSQDWSYVLNHEFSHMIDSRLLYAQTQMELDIGFSEEEWNTLNPSGFEYLFRYSDFENRQLADIYPDYFIDNYGTTYPTEDRAELFGYAMQYAVDDFAEYIKSSYSSEEKLKLTYYTRSIRKGFQSADWADILPWEEILQ